ncbi:hypothetical protein ACJX0J_029326, partial [Zea mays]
MLEKRSTCQHLESICLKTYMRILKKTSITCATCCVKCVGFVEVCFFIEPLVLPSIICHYLLALMDIYIILYEILVTVCHNSQEKKCDYWFLFATTISKCYILPHSNIDIPYRLAEVHVDQPLYFSYEIMILNYILVIIVWPFYIKVLKNT